MSGLLKLNQKARRAVVHILAPAEPIVFVTTPDPREAARAAWPTAVAGALLAVLGAPLAWVALEASFVGFRSGEVPIVALLFALAMVPAFLMGVYLMLAPRAAARKARDTVILVTDRRLLTISIAKRSATDLPARAILGVERKKVERGYGTLEIRHEAQGDAAETVLSGIDDVLTAETAIRRLSVDRSITIISPVH
jgi:hypothetical protein